MTREELLKGEIKRSFKSVSAFARMIGVPESSLRNLFVKGLDSVSVGLFLRVCRALKISADAMAEGRIEYRSPGGGAVSEDAALLAGLSGLNRAGKQKVAEYVADIGANPAYTKDSPQQEEEAG